VTVGLLLEAGAYATAVDERLSAWTIERFAARLWEKDPTLWSAEPVPELEDRLGWLDLPTRMGKKVEGLEAFGREVSGGGFRHVVVLGMGGSSLAPEVYQAVFGNRPEYPELLVLDSTHPSSVLAIEQEISLAHTLFIVSSKSGTTIETLSFFRYFWDRAANESKAPGDHFVAITDGGGPLESLAAERSFRRVFNPPADVGGRYSALTEFGLVPAAAIGVDLHQLIEGADRAARMCGPNTVTAHNPGLALGAFLGELAIAGRNKATFLAPPSLRPLVAWVEQLVAESTGKDQTGIAPVGGDEGAATLGHDRALVVIGLENDASRGHLAPRGDRSPPAAHLRLGSVADLGGAMFVLEVAIAAASSALTINPFDQPDVQVAKDLARRAMDGGLDAGQVEEVDALDARLQERIAEWLRGIQPPEYVGLHAYLPPTAATRVALETARAAIRDERGVAAMFDFGPRFLHSTGQLHKGGPPVGRFLQVIDRAVPHLDVPETDFGFEDLIAAQAIGDIKALQDRGQQVLRVNLGATGAEGLETVMTAVVAAAKQ
jgi:transaldolase/glucose-6-phosphate isomerase